MKINPYVTLPKSLLSQHSKDERFRPNQKDDSLTSASTSQTLLLWMHKIKNEGRLVWQCINRDLTMTVIPSSLFIIAAWSNDPSSITSLLRFLVCGLIYFGLSLFAFCLSNQIIGIEEDKLNKPDRPLVAGTLSYTGAQIRCAISIILLILLGYWLGILEWTLLTLLFIFLHNFMSLANHWATKNLLVAYAIFVNLGASWQLVTPLTPKVWHWIFLLAAMISCVIHIQDLRDIEGDRAISRNTFPIAFGESFTRITLCCTFGLLPLLVHFAIASFALSSWQFLLFDGVLAIGCWSIATRLIYYRSPQADHQTYMLFTYWYTVAVASAIAVL
ncbi:MAG: UbiA family prenyltransferase [Calothrix sp. MO_167.B12]|nr:UbiA family prenyltransferase [Calothrix sp. MO_167.B12]